MQSLGAHLRRAGADDSGLSVLEIVVASAILLICSVSVIGALTFGSTATAQTSMRAHALSLANQRIEYARNLAYDETGIVSETVGGKIPREEVIGPFTVTTDVSWAVGTSGTGAPVKKYKTILVTVDWSRPRPGTISVSSAIYGKSYLVNVGDIQVRVRDAETGMPITSAQVWLHRPEDPDVWRQVEPDGEQAGNAIFGDLSTQPSALASVTVDAGEMYVFDEAALANITVIPDYVTSVVALGYRAGSVTVHIVDRTGKKVSPAKVWVTPADGVLSGNGEAVAGDGIVTVGRLRKGDYVVTVLAPNRTVSETRFSLSQGGQNVELWVELADMVLPGSLTVQVRDPNGMPLDGVSVGLLGPAPVLVPVDGSPVNSVNGEAVYNLTPGEYRVSTFLAGYTSVTTSATVVDNEAATCPIVLTPVGPTGSLKIIIEGAAGPTVGLPVRITYPSAKFITIPTDANGEILLGNLVPGKYLVEPAGMAMTEHTVYAGQLIEVRRTGP